MRAGADLADLREHQTAQQTNETRFQEHTRDCFPFCFGGEEHTTSIKYAWQIRVEDSLTHM